MPSLFSAIIGYVASATATLYKFDQPRPTPLKDRPQLSFFKADYWPLGYKAYSLLICSSCYFEPVEAIRTEQHQMDHRGQQEQENTLRYKDTTRIKNEPDFVKLSHYLISLKQTTETR
jgi:hypothetical protein